MHQNWHTYKKWVFPTLSFCDAHFTVWNKWRTNGNISVAILYILSLLWIRQRYIYCAFLLIFINGFAWVRICQDPNAHSLMLPSTDLPAEGCCHKCSQPWPPLGVDFNKCHTSCSSFNLQPSGIDQDEFMMFYMFFYSDCDCIHYMFQQCSPPHVWPQCASSHSAKWSHSHLLHMVSPLAFLPAPSTPPHNFPTSISL